MDRRDVVTPTGLIGRPRAELGSPHGHAGLPPGNRGPGALARTERPAAPGALDVLGALAGQPGVWVIDSRTIGRRRSRSDTMA